MDDLNDVRDEEALPHHVPQVANPPRVLRDYALPLIGIQSEIQRPIIQANNFKIKPISLQLIQAI